MQAVKKKGPPLVVEMKKGDETQLPQLPGPDPVWVPNGCVKKGVNSTSLRV